MNRSGNSTKRLLSLKQSEAENVDSPTIAAQTENRDQILDGLIAKACQLTGTRTHEFADHIIVQVGNALVWPKPKGELEPLIKAFAAVAEMAPQNATEAMLAAQMIACHDTAMNFLARATAPEQCVDIVDRNVLRATRLMRIFGEQLEAMQKLKGKTSQQRVTVEHVHVNAGGQAVVGAVTTANREGIGGE